MTDPFGAVVRILGAGLVLPRPAPEPYPLPENLGPACLAYACERNPAACVLPASALRRLGRAQQMALAASAQALAEAGLGEERRADIAVCVGTGLGELGNTYTFLENLIRLDEEQPKPAAFINSVHNAIGGQLAIQLGCRGENHTFLNGPCSFESALWQGIHLLERSRAEHVLVCGVDELNGYMIGASRGLKLYREGAEPLSPLSALAQAGRGTLPGEGAGAFVLSAAGAEPDASRPRIETWCLEAAGGDPQSMDPEAELRGFGIALAQGGLQAREIDFVICNADGDALLDGRYNQVLGLLAQRVGPALAIGSFKSVTGDFHAASALGVGLCVETLRRGERAGAVQWRGAPPDPGAKTGLFYNLNPTTTRGISVVRA